MIYKDGVCATITGLVFEKAKKFGKKEEVLAETELKVSTSVQAGVMIFELPEKKIKFTCKTQDVLAVLREGNKAFEKTKGIEKGKGSMRCPRCGKTTERLLALSRADNKTMICDQCGMEEALESLGGAGGRTEEAANIYIKGLFPRGTPQERTRAAVNATGNKWAMENFRDTHN